MLPATLDGYFQRILDKVHPQYRRFNARLLLMSVRHHGLSLGYVHSLWLLENDELNSRPQVAVTAGRKQPRFATTSWHPETRLRITKICSDFLTLSDGLYIEHNHRSVGDFLELPAVENELFALAEWHVESDIYLVLCQLFVSSCQANLIEMEGYGEVEQFTDNAREYERCSGTACADLVYTLDKVLSSRVPPFTQNSIRHWSGRLLDLCHPKWTIRKKQSLLLYMAYHGLALFLQQEVENLPTESQVVVLNDLLEALLLGCYHHIFQDERDLSKTIRFLCSKGANVNPVARTTFTPVADGNVDINIESSGLVNSHKSETDLRLDVVDSTEELTSRTIWELYLQECDFKGRHFQNYEPDAVALTQILIESGADLECRIPDDCESIQQAIAKRLEADKLELGLDTEMEPILNALSKRGYGV
jgi:hypothetical protein